MFKPVDNPCRFIYCRIPAKTCKYFILVSFFFSFVARIQEEEKEKLTSCWSRKKYSKRELFKSSKRQEWKEKIWDPNCYFDEWVWKRTSINYQVKQRRKQAFSSDINYQRKTSPLFISAKFNQFFSTKNTYSEVILKPLVRAIYTNILLPVATLSIFLKVGSWRVIDTQIWVRSLPSRLNKVKMQASPQPSPNNSSHFLPFHFPLSGLQFHVPFQYLLL